MFYRNLEKCVKGMRETRVKQIKIILLENMMKQYYLYDLLNWNTIYFKNSILNFRKY